MSFSGGLSQQPAYFFLPDVRGLSSPFCTRVKEASQEETAGLAADLPIGLRPISWPTEAPLHQIQAISRAAAQEGEQSPCRQARKPRRVTLKPGGTSRDA